MNSMCHRLSIIVAGVSASFLLLACSAFALASSDGQQSKVDRRADQAIAVLVQMTDADSLAAAGLMTVGKNSGQSLAFLARATVIDPNRPDLVWLRVARCVQLPPCDPEPIERRLRELDPANSISWWSSLARAGVAHNSEGLKAALITVGHSERLDIYWTTLIAHLSRAVTKTKKMSIAESEVAIIGYLAALLPPYQYVSASCKGERLQEPGVTETCRGVARALQNGDNYLTEMIGVAIAKRVWPEDSPEWKAAAEERRVYDYRSRLYPKLEQRALTHPGEYLDLCAQNRRKQDVFAAQLTAAGYDPNPPLQP